MDKKLEKQIILNGKYEDVLQENDHFYIIHKLDKICVIPYTISSNGLLDKVGVIKELDVKKEKHQYSLINGYINEDDSTSLVAANRLLFDIIGSNVKQADNWMYLGTVDNTAVGSNVILWGANLTDVYINESPEVEETKKQMKFEMIESNKVVGSDDALFLAAYMRLFNYFYILNIK